MRALNRPETVDDGEWHGDAASRRFVARAHPWVAGAEDVIYVANGLGAPIRLAAPTLWAWEELQQPRTIEQVRAALLDGTAGPDDGCSLIFIQIQALMSHGLVGIVGHSVDWPSPTRLLTFPRPHG